MGLLLPTLVLANGAGAQVVERGGLSVGGAVRQNVVYRSWSEPDGLLNSLEFDTAFLDLGYSEGGWIGSAQWRLYYSHKGDDQVTSFVHHAWIGRRLADGGEIHVGINKVPFGLQPFASNSWFFSLAFYLGLEDDYDLGVKYVSPPDRRLQWQLAAYEGDEGAGFGDSRDSARYAFDVVDEGRGNREGARLNGWVNYRVTDGDDGLRAWIGISAQYGKVPNRLSGDKGDHWAVAAHFQGEHGRFGLQWQSLWYAFDLRNPAEFDDAVVTLGAYDAPYLAAARGSLHGVNLTWKPPVLLSGLKTLTLYNDFSVLMKSSSGFGASYHNITGASLDFEGPLFIFADLGIGRGSPFLTPDYARGLAEGGDRWHARFNINLGLYF